ncbi:UV excision repair protein Rad23 [Pholiota conissans]|uniref:UV excision repair protein RAD23 n=1 Tax=Pholiota conissans TaxID=109636 RepID=A0A9P5Z0N2_9AGAR|nr:UV excision repair protein Rad23 [Pholiota conissans]
MKITIKTTQQKIFQVDVEPSETIADLKAKIYTSQGHPVAVQKIIYSGKILTDDKTVESCGFKEKDFLVLMVSKPKPTPAATSSTPAAVVEPPAQVAQPQAAPAAAPTVPAETTPPPAQVPSSAPPPAFGDPSSFLSGATLQNAINGMVEMGFPREQVLRAMRASFNNADRAVEYLMTEIPAHLEAEAAPPAAQPVSIPAAAPPAAAAPQPQPAGQPQNLFQLAQQQQQQQQQAGSAGPGGGPGGQLNLEALRNNPQIQQLRQQMAANPNMIGPLIQQLAGQNPAIAQMIAQNPEALFQLLGVDIGDDGEEGGQLPPGAHVVSVTEEERAAIQRLEALGFERQAVLEAYFACDKNEELAANYLFEGGFDN